MLNLFQHPPVSPNETLKQVQGDELVLCLAGINMYKQNLIVKSAIDSVPKATFFKLQKA
jgi:hypothetical protein